MEVNDIELLSSALLSACESARSAGKSTIDTVSLFRDVNLKQIAKDLLQLISISTSISTLNPPRCIGKWKSNPAESGLPSLNTSLAACFTSLLEDDPETPEERIRQRFSYLFFYRMEHICNKHVTGDLMLARMIQLSGLEMNAGKILKHLRLFLDRGERFELLSDGLGGPGILFMLSENPEYLYVLLPL
ncbi:hypothetical protein BJX63DRAFT_408646 [Aspergillus granulosus]|uniref:Uncharacterized protein n=1 Tax=Aspergillus granulosus TaxID=176169 RepID=A0ABR4GZK0_9EURO